jgi:FkbM family methyltransferase
LAVYETISVSENLENSFCAWFWEICKMGYIQKLRDVRRRLKRFNDIHIKKDEFMKNIYKWQDDKGDQTLRLSYPLDENSIVFDVGGYIGNFAADIFCKYNCNIYIFEPVTEFYEKIKARFSNNPKVNVFHAGLSDRSSTAKISVNGTSSSVFKTNSENTEEIKLISIVNFIKDHEIKGIDLMKINIEGGEYPLLDSLIKNNLLDIARNYQIQFHWFIPDAKQQRENIRAELSKTHRLLWDYPFVWENWERV